MKFKEILPNLLVAGTVMSTSLLPISAEAKPNYQSEISVQAQREPTIREDLKRYGNKAKKAGSRFFNNLKERNTDRILWKAKRCEITKSKTENCQSSIKKAREINK